MFYFPIKFNMMKKIFLFLCTLPFAFNLYAQSMAINTDGSIANSTAMLDVKSTTKGFLPPRMTQVQRDAIASPATGLIVQCTDCSTIGPYTYNGTTWISMSYKTYKIGDLAQGGIVFWVDDSEHHGLVAGLADLVNPGPWHSVSAVPAYINKVRNDGIYTGRITTDAIIALWASASFPYAAQGCAQYLGGGYGDWYLPSKYELDLLYQQRNIVGGLLGFSYWSSTEVDTQYAYEQYFTTGNQVQGQKNNTRSVRAIRSF